MALTPGNVIIIALAAYALYKAAMALLRIGFHVGYKQAVSDAEALVNEIRSKEAKTSVK